MKIPFGKPMITQDEIDAVTEVLNSSLLVHGPKSTEFEQLFGEFTGAPYAVSVSSCTAGMHLIYFALGFGAGDEVIVPAQTHMATAHAVELTGAKPVFVDAELTTGNMDLNKLEQAITKNTKAISVVHYLGVPVDMKKVCEIAKKHDLFVLEDCALSIGAKLDGTHTGLHGDAGVFSFYPVKHLTTAEGGMIILKDKELASRLSRLKAFGVDRTHTERKIPGVYDAPELGFNYRMSDIHAAIGIAQMSKVDEFLLRRKNNFGMLASELANLTCARVLEHSSNDRFQSSHYCLGLILNEELKHTRPKIIEKLTELGIGTSVYYPHPVPRIAYYKNKYGYDEVKFINAALISDAILALPVGPHLNEHDMVTIADAVKMVLEEMI